MNCRRVSNLLSAFLDAEMTGSEMLEIRRHLDECPSCRAEYQTLRDTKHLLSALALRTPRADFDRMLRAEIDRASHPLTRWMPSWLMAWQEGLTPAPKLKPLVATVALSLAGLLLATATVDTPVATATTAMVAPDVYTPYIGPHAVYRSNVPLVDQTPLRWQYKQNPNLFAAHGADARVERAFFPDNRQNPGVLNAFNAGFSRAYYPARSGR